MVDQYEMAYANALAAIAMGATRAETHEDIRESYRGINESDIREAMHDALHDALKQGVEREDIDDSWF